MANEKHASIRVREQKTNTIMQNISHIYNIT